jgi:hypothetical protein
MFQEGAPQFRIASANFQIFLINNYSIEQAFSLSITLNSLFLLMCYFNCFVLVLYGGTWANTSTAESMGTYTVLSICNLVKFYGMELMMLAALMKQLW